MSTETNRVRKLLKALVAYYTSGEAGAMGVVNLETVAQAQAFNADSLWGYPVSGDHIRTLGEELCKH